MNEQEEKRLWNLLDGINEKLETLVRLEEKMTVIENHTSRLNNHGARLRDAELWQAEHGNKCIIESKVDHIDEELENFKEEVHADHEKFWSILNKITRTDIRDLGRKDIVRKVMKIIGSLLLAAWMGFITWITAKGGTP